MFCVQAPLYGPATSSDRTACTGSGTPACTVTHLPMARTELKRKPFGGPRLLLGTLLGYRVKLGIHSVQIDTRLHSTAFRLHPNSVYGRISVVSEPKNKTWRESDLVYNRHA